MQICQISHLTKAIPLFFLENFPRDKQKSQMLQKYKLIQCICCDISNEAFKIVKTVIKIFLLEKKIK